MLISSLLPQRVFQINLADHIADLCRKHLSAQIREILHHKGRKITPFLPLQGHSLCNFILPVVIEHGSVKKHAGGIYLNPLQKLPGVLRRPACGNAEIAAPLRKAPQSLPILLGNLALRAEQCPIHIRNQHIITIFTHQTAS